LLDVPAILANGERPETAEHFSAEAGQ